MDRGGRFIEDDLDPCVGACFEDDFDDIGVEGFEGLIRAMDNGDFFCSGTDGNVGEFEGDVSATDEGDALGQFGEIEKIIADLDVFHSRDLGAAGRGTGG